jgi:hypothetical protein
VFFSREADKGPKEGPHEAGLEGTFLESEKADRRAELVNENPDEEDEDLNACERPPIGD